MFLRQFFETDTCTFTYLIADKVGGEAAIIDPVLKCVDTYIHFINEFDLKLVYTLETHTHADHITGASRLHAELGANIVMGAQSQASCINQYINDSDTLSLGELTITALHTPGHTDDSYSFACEDALFTGDTLLIRGTGRTDFQHGNAKLQYRMITEKLFSYPDNTRVFPGHDYKVATISTIGEEKRFNPRLQVASADEYAAIMDNLNLPRPKHIDEAVPANLQCGQTIAEN